MLPRLMLVLTLLPTASASEATRSGLIITPAVTALFFSATNSSTLVHGPGKVAVRDAVGDISGRFVTAGPGQI